MLVKASKAPENAIYYVDVDGCFSNNYKGVEKFTCESDAINYFYDHQEIDLYISDENGNTLFDF